MTSFSLHRHRIDHCHDSHSLRLQERNPLIQHPSPPADQHPDDPPGLQNNLSRADTWWILVGLWSSVFLGALDGWPFHPIFFIKSMRVFIGTVVATLMTSIGSYFSRSNQSSYIGTSYLLSVCCFTPLYGECHRHHCMHYNTCLSFRPIVRHIRSQRRYVVSPISLWCAVVNQLVNR
jgi:hypothetical protein